MIITETNIPDEILENIDQSKIDLADKIINNVQPLLDEVFNEKVASARILAKKYSEKKKLVSEKKTSLEEMFKSYKIKQKVKKLLERIDKLVSSGLIEGQSKHDMVVLLKVIDDLPDDKLNYHLKNTMNIITKRFN
jgi:ribosomal protein L14E/L6E/L27E